jgi:hypothetical protein
LDNSGVTGHDNEEIEDIPGIFEIGLLLTEESHTQDLEDHFDGIKHEEDRLEDGPDGIWVVIGAGVIQDHSKRVGKNNTDGNVVECLRVDDVVACHLDQNNHSEDGLPQDQQGESISVNVKLFKVVLLSDFENLGVLFLNFLDVGAFLKTFRIFLLPLAHGLESGLLELLEAEPFGVVERVQGGLGVLALVNGARVDGVMADHAPWLHIGPIIGRMILLLCLI